MEAAPVPPGQGALRGAGKRGDRRRRGLCPDRRGGHHRAGRFRGTAEDGPDRRRPELPLTLGIVDEFQKRGLAIFGPTRLAAELEGSKVFSKEFMRKYGIPTAEARACSSVDEAKSALKEFGYPSVIKVDGLAAGKGVVIVQSKKEADEY